MMVDLNRHPDYIKKAIREAYKKAEIKINAMNVTKFNFRYKTGFNRNIFTKILNNK